MFVFLGVTVLLVSYSGGGRLEESLRKLYWVFARVELKS